MLLAAFVAQVGPLVEGADGRWLRPRDEQFSEELLMAFGRAVGLVLRISGSVTDLRFAPRLVALIHSMALADEPLSTAEAIYNFHKGSVDVLGVLGFRVFRARDLHTHFGTIVGK